MKPPSLPMTYLRWQQGICPGGIDPLSRAATEVNGDGKPLDWNYEKR